MAFLTDGYQTLIGFVDAPLLGLGDLTLVMKEKEVQPPDIDGGGELDTTTMRNVTWRTKQPKSLFTLGDVTAQIQYDPIIYTSILVLLNRNTRIGIRFPDLSALSFFGWVDKFTPPSHKEGDFVIAELKIHCSNQNNSGVEVAPVFFAGPILDANFPAALSV